MLLILSPKQTVSKVFQLGQRTYYFPDNSFMPGARRGVNLPSKEITSDAAAAIGVTPVLNHQQSFSDPQLSSAWAKLRSEAGIWWNLQVLHGSASV